MFCDDDDYDDDDDNVDDDDDDVGSDCNQHYAPVNPLSVFYFFFFVFCRNCASISTVLKLYHVRTLVSD